MSRTMLQRPTAGDPRRAAPSYASGPQPGARRRALALPVVVLIIVVAAAAAGAGTWFAIGHARAGRPPAILPASSPAAASSPASGLVPGGPSALAPLAALAPAAALYPGAVAIEKVIDRYFQAINRRDYAGYLTTQSADNAMTASQFQTGFESTPGFGRAHHRHHVRVRRTPGRRRDLYQPAAAAGRPGGRVLHDLARDDVLRRQRRDLHHRGAAERLQSGLSGLHSLSVGMGDSGAR